MNDENYNMIFKRKSFHLFPNDSALKITSVELDEIEQQFNKLNPLISNIKTEIRIVEASKTTCKRNQEYCILFYSEEKDNYLQNIGYLGEQLDLYLVSKNIGSLWFGIGKTNEPSFNGLSFVIMIAISKIDDNNKFRKDMFKAKRKSINEIWHGETIDGISNIVRFAPSACNTQPWFVKHIKNTLKIYRYKKHGKRGIMPIDKVIFYNQIDIGIFIYFMSLCLHHNHINFDIELVNDSNSNKELTLNAIYKIKNNA